MGAERLEDVADRLSVAGTWRLDRRRFLQLAGAGGLVGMAGLAGVQRSTLSPGPGPALAATPAVSPPPVLTSVIDLARSLEYDVDRIFRFVADEIRYEPYAGALRGAQGTLDGRAGNSADQSVLLASLLDASLVPHRFVAGPLLSGSAELLLGSTQIDAATALADARAISRGTIVTAPVSRNDLAPEVLPLLDRLPALAQSVRETAQSQLDASIRTIIDALAANAISPPTALSEVPARERDAHMWVQMASGPDWVDLDASTPSARSGQTIASPSGDPFVTLPDGLRHRVELTLTAETIQGTGLAQHTILEHAEFADELNGVPIGLVHDKPEGLKGVGVSIAGTLTGTIQYLPVLSIGDHSTIGLSGLTFGASGGILSGFGGETGRDGEATAEWLEIRVISPDGTMSTSRRTLFDRVGDTARRGGAVDVASIPPVQLVDLDPEVTNEFVPCRTLHFLAVATGSTSGDLVTRFATADNAPDPIQLAGYLYHMGRDAMAADLGVARGVRTFLDAPNITAFTIGLDASSLDPSKAIFAFDLLNRSYGSLAVEGAQPAASAGVVAGVLSHVAERVALGDGLPVDLAPEGARVGVGAVFDAAASQGIGTRVLHGSVPAGLPYSADVLARLATHVSEGWAVVLPERSVSVAGSDRVGWWLVRPETGETIDEMEDGGGDEFEEETWGLDNLLWETSKSFLKLGACVALVLHEVHSIYELVAGDFFDEGLPSLMLMFVLGPLHKVLCH